MSYLFSDHQLALEELGFPDAMAVSPHFDAPAMVPVHKSVSELTVGVLVSLGPARPVRNRCSAPTTCPSA